MASPPKTTSSSTTPSQAGEGERGQRQIKTIFFDFMGTCLDWHTGVVDALPSAIPEPTRSKMALDWRHEFFNELHARSQLGLPPEDIDITYRRTLLRILNSDMYKDDSHRFRQGKSSLALPRDGEMPTGISSIEKAVDSWHTQKAWPDVLPALTALKRDHGLELFVLANGTTRLQLDLARSAGLSAVFDMLLSSELLGVYKPAPEAYEKALRLVGVRPDEAVMVAAHAYDLRAARKLGMKTVYVHRWTDDVQEDMEVVKHENSVFLGSEGMKGLVEAIQNL